MPTRRDDPLDTLGRLAPRVTAWAVLDTMTPAGQPPSPPGTLVARIVAKHTKRGAGCTAVVHWFGIEARQGHTTGRYGRSVLWRAVAKAARAHRKPAYAGEPEGVVWTPDGSRLDAFLTALADDSQWSNHGHLEAAGFRLVPVL